MGHFIPPPPSAVLNTSEKARFFNQICSDDTMNVDLLCSYKLQIVHRHLSLVSYSHLAEQVHFQPSFS